MFLKIRRRKAKRSDEMTIIEHLIEARRRLFFALWGIAVGTGVGWFTYEWVIAEITAPLTGKTPLLFSLFNLPFNSLDSTQLSLNFTTVAGAFDLKFKVALWTGTIISSPWWLSQIWIYIAPGLRRKEKIYLISFALVAWLLFTFGVLTGMWVAPQAVVLLADFAPSGASNFISANSYFSFYMTLVLFFGLTTLIPEILVALNFIGILSAKNLLRGWRVAVIGSFTFAAITNPIPNPTSMIIQGLLLCLLYLLALAIAAGHDWHIHRKNKAKKVTE